MQQLDQSIHSKEVIFNGYLNNRLRTYILLDRLILFFIIIPILNRLLFFIVLGIASASSLINKTDK